MMRRNLKNRVLALVMAGMMVFNNGAVQVAAEAVTEQSAQAQTEELQLKAAEAETQAATQAETQPQTQAETPAPETQPATQAETPAPDTAAPETQAETAAPETAAETQAETAAPETAAETQAETQAPETQPATQAETAASETQPASQPETTAETAAGLTDETDKIDQPEETEAEDETPTEKETDLDEEEDGEIMAAAMSSDLANFTSGASIKEQNGSAVQTDGNGVYQVTTDKTYNVTVSFAESYASYWDNMQFGNAPLTYKLPAGFVPDAHSDNLVISGSDYWGTYTISANTFTVNKDGTVTVNWDTTDDNYQRLMMSPNVEFSLNFNGHFTENAGLLDFGNDVTKTVNVDSTADASVAKSGYYSADDGKVHYTVTVTGNKGTVSNLRVVDTMTATGLNIDTNSMVTKLNYNATSLTATSLTAKGFEYTIPTVSQGQVYTFEYTAAVDRSKITGNGTAVQTQNGVTISGDTSNENNNSVTTNLENQIGGTALWKGVDGNPADAGDGHKTLNWRVEYNEKHLSNVGGMTITDSIDVSSTSIMKYTGSVSITVKDANGQVVRTDTVTPAANATSWQYQIPATDSNYSYTAQYKTDVTVGNNSQTVQVKNKVGDGHGAETYGTGNIGPNAASAFAVDKQYVSSTADTMTWKILLTVPANGLNSAFVRERYPATSIAGVTRRDLIQSLSVEGLVDGESYLVDKTESDDYAKIVFFKDGAQSQQGLKAVAGGRTITINVVTKCDETWLATDMQNKDHRNTAEFVADGKQETDADFGYPVQPSIKKTMCGGNTESDTGLPYWRYEVNVGGVAGDLNITETFDTSLFEIAMPSNNWEPVCGRVDAGANEYTFDHIAVATATWTGTSTGATISVPAASLKKTDGTYYAFYKVTYYLKVKDAAALKKIQGFAAASDNGYTFSNNANFGGKGATANATYSFTPVEKQITNYGYKDIDGNNYAEFKLVLNPTAAQIGDAATLQATDTWTNLAIDYKSINADPNLDTVTWDVKGSTATFNIPNATTVTITYRARILGSGNVSYSNTATLNGKAVTQYGQHDNGQSGSGTASNVQINILKCEDGNMKKVLSGAKFALYDTTTGKQVTGKNGPVYFTTNSEGLATVVGSGDADDWALVKNREYYIKEVTAPEGYQINEIEYHFKIANESDHSKYIYVNNDTLTVKDKPLPAQITISKTVYSPVASDYTKQFTFIVMLRRADENGTLQNLEDGTYDAVITTEGGTSQNTTMTLSNGAGRVMLTDKQTVRITVPNGTVYAVVEVTDDDFNSTCKYNQGTANAGANQAPTATFFNSRKVGKLKITKTFAGDDDKLTEAQKKAITFSVKNAAGAEIANVTYADFAKDGTYLIENLVPGDYTVTESNAAVAGFEVETKYDGSVETNKTVTVAANRTAETVITNTYNKLEGSLTFTKTIAGLPEGNVPAISFTVTGADEANASYEETFALADLEKDANGVYSMTIEHLALGNYTVTESGEDVEGYSLTKAYVVGETTTEESATAEVTDGNEVTVDITNTYEQLLGALKIAKTFTGDENKLTEEQKNAVTFEITDAEGNEIETVTYADFEEDGTYTVGDLVPGTYTVTETNANFGGFERTTTIDATETDSADVEVTAPATVDEDVIPAVVEITNDYNKLEGSLTFTKTFAGDPLTADQIPALTFTVESDAALEGGEKVYSEEFSLSDMTQTATGYTMTIDELPLGGYTVTESAANVDGYSVVTKYMVGETETASATVTDGGEVTVDITNTYTQLKGGLTITKTFAGDTADLTEEQKKAIEFTVTDADGKEIASVTYADFDEKGTYQISDLVPGSYTVVETNKDIDGYEVSTTYNGEVTEGTTVEITENNGTVTGAAVAITNNYNKLEGSLTFTKTIAGLPEDEIPEITFTVAGADEENTSYEETFALADLVKDSNGVYSMTIEHLALGNYTVTESGEDVEGYSVVTEYAVGETTTEESATAEVTDGNEVTVDITNTYEQLLGALKITKTFTGDEDKLTTAQKEAVTFTVTDAEGNTIDEVTYADFEADGTYTVEDLVPGTYTVTETNANFGGFERTTTISTTEGDSADVEVVYEQTVVVEITNDYNKLEGSLTFTKTFAGDPLTAEQIPALTFTVESDAALEGGEKVYSEEFSLSDMTQTATGYTMTIDELPLGGYTVTESAANVDGYSVVTKYMVGETETSSATVTDGGEVTVDITNTYTQLKGGLTITKSFTGDTADLTEEQKKAITFTVTDASGATVANVTYADFDENGTYQISDLVPDSYTVVETNKDIDGYEVSTTYNGEVTEGTTVEITENNGTVTGAAVAITNKYNKLEGSLTFTKTIAGLPEDEIPEITFTVAGADEENASYEETYALADMDLGEDGVYSMTIEHLALGNYTVTESGEDVEGYSLTKAYVVGETTTEESATAEVTDGNEVTVDITNTYEQLLGALKIAKTFTGDEDKLTEEQKNAVTFEITDAEGNEIETVTYADFEEDGTYTVEDLVPGTYTVTETNANFGGFERTTTIDATETDSTDVEVAYEQTAEVAITNDYNKLEGSLTFTKTFAGEPLTAEQIPALTFKVESDAALEGGEKVYSEEFELSDMALTDGVYSMTIDELPLGGYTVTESDASVEGYSVVTKYMVGETETSSATVTDGGEVTIDITNTYTQLKGGLTITKTFTGDTAELTDTQKNAITFTVSGPTGFTPVTVTYDKFENNSYTFENLIPGTYTVTESNTAIKGYEVTTSYDGTVAENKEVALTYKGAAVAITNDYNKLEGSLTFTKTFAGDKLPTDKIPEIIFKVEQTNTLDGVAGFSKNYKLSEMTFANGAYSYTVEHLELGDYIVTETNADVDGYLRETQISVNKSDTEYARVTDGQDIRVDITNTYEQTSVSIKKVDVADGEELEGAHIQVLDKDGKVVEEWDSTKEAHEVKGLKVGEQYTLRETVAPDGYTITTDTTFELDENGKIDKEKTTTTTDAEDTLLVEDTKTVIKVSKVDAVGGEELEGAHIQILDKEGNVVDEWDSTKEAHSVSGLKIETEYTLRETVAPDGYTITTDTTFTIDKEGKIDKDKTTTTTSEEGTLLVEDTKTKITVKKVDAVGGEELDGAHIQILDKEGNVVDEWDSKAGQPHVVEGLKVETEYTLRETVAPDGYTITTDTTFTIDKEGKIDKDQTTTTCDTDDVLLVEDTKTKIRIKKVDIGTGEELSGAHIQVLDEDGNVVDEWVSEEGRAHEVEGLKVNTVYTIRETVAPDGYELTTDTTFVMDENGKIIPGRTTTTVEDGVLLVEDTRRTASGQFQPTAKKTLKGAELKADQFTFELKDSTGTVLESQKNAATGTVTFTPITYTFGDAGKTFTYTISEVNDKQENMTYDTSVYTAEVKVVDQGTKELSIEVTWTKDGKTVETPEFINEYEKITETESETPKKPNGPGTPQTGDETPILPYTMMMFAAAALIAAIADRKRRTSKN